MKKHITLYTDGACKGNPGAGGWAAILIYQDAEKELSGAEVHTTNNRMELMGVIKGLSELKEPCDVDLYTDSIYVKDGCKQWMHKWVKNGWLTATKHPVKNQDLWMELYDLLHKHTVNLFWVKGHSGDPLNERADQLANEAILTLSKRKSYI
jgi:ribonuclease HI